MVPKGMNSVVPLRSGGGVEVVMDLIINQPVERNRTTLLDRIQITSNVLLMVSKLPNGNVQIRLGRSVEVVVPVVIDSPEERDRSRNLFGEDESGGTFTAVSQCNRIFHVLGSGRVEVVGPGGIVCAHELDCG